MPNANETTYKRELSKYKRLLKKRDEAGEAVAKQRKKLQIGCKHPTDFVVEYRWEHDNGYGRQSWQMGKMCQICYAKDLWNDGRFYGNTTENS